MNSEPLTPAQRERLYLLIEEAGEVIQAATKCLRHGYESYNPLDPEKRYNYAELEKEIGHLEHAVDRLALKNEVRLNRICAAKATKWTTVEQWLHYQGDEK